MKVGLDYKNKKISLDVKKCNFFQRGVGLTFKSRENAKALLFDGLSKRKYPLTAVFVFFPFIVLWLDDKNKVLDLKTVKPFTFFIDSKSEYSKIIEIPINEFYKKYASSLVGRKFYK